MRDCLVAKNLFQQNRKVVKIKHNMQEYKLIIKFDCPHIPTSNSSRALLNSTPPDSSIDAACRCRPIPQRQSQHKNACYRLSGTSPSKVWKFNNIIEAPEYVHSVGRDISLYNWYRNSNHLNIERWRSDHFNSGGKSRACETPPNDSVVYRSAHG